MPAQGQSKQAFFYGWYIVGLGFLITQLFSAGGPPFFGFLFDATKSYFTSFVIFTIALIISAFLILLVRPPQK